MPIKKSDLYASIWKSCDQLRGGMDASQYKDYVLTTLFIKYVSDKYAGNEDALLIIPEGSGSLILKVADEAPVDITIYGQEMDVATTALAKMNMVLHNRPEAVHDIRRGNTLADPKFLENGVLKRFDYAVANPPFSYKAWTIIIDQCNPAATKQTQPCPNSEGVQHQ